MGWTRIGVLTEKQVKEAEAKGFKKCAVCRAYKPIMNDDCLCFRCLQWMKSGKEPDKITVTRY